ncbi:hypothetical protein Dimus_019111 [Dionaea muscipula]
MLKNSPFVRVRLDVSGFFQLHTNVRGNVVCCPARLATRAVQELAGSPTLRNVPKKIISSDHVPDYTLVAATDNFPATLTCASICISKWLAARASMPMCLLH